MNFVNEEKGFTLLEVLIAVAIFTIGILSVNAMQIGSIKGNMGANRMTSATNWASDRVELLLSSDYSSLTDSNKVDKDNNAVADNGVAGLDNDTAATADGSDTSPDGQYTIFWNVAVDEIMPKTKTVRVIVTRTDAGITKSVVLNHNIPEII